MSKKRSTFCEQCGQPIQKNDKFCGSCGAAVLPPISQAEQAAPQQEAASFTPVRRRRFPQIFVVSILAVVAVLGGALAVAALQSGSVLQGNADPDPPVAVPVPEATERDIPEDKSSPDESSTSSGSSPHAAFDPLLDELQSRTDVPIMLPAELSSKLQNVAVDEDLSGDRYGVAFFVEPPDDIVEFWGRSGVYGTLQTTPVSEAASNEFFEAESVDDVELSNGTTATLRLLNPVNDQAGTQGEFWEGKFQRKGHEYTLTFLDPARVSKDEAVQALSSMVLAPESSDTPVPEISPESTEDEEVQEFIFDYYEAVEREDWATTYSLLADTSQEQFTEEEWVEIQELRQESEGEPSPLAAVETEVSEEFVISADLTFEDGSSGTTRVLYTPSTGEYGRLLTEEDVSYLRSLNEGASFEGDMVIVSDVEGTIRNHYSAIGNGDFYSAYSYFGPTFRSENSEENWVAEEESYEITSSTVNSVEFEETSETSATATVDVSFEDNTGSPRFLITWELVKEGEEWKLDEVSSAQEL